MAAGGEIIEFGRFRLHRRNRTLQADGQELDLGVRAISSVTRGIHFPRIEFSRIEVFGRAATAQTEVVASNRRDHECGVALGADIVEVLAAAERSAAQGCPVSTVSR
jgi:hypothetical protein